MTPDETLQIGDLYVNQIIQLFGGYRRMANACLLDQVTPETVLTWRHNGIPNAKNIRDSIRSGARRCLKQHEAATVIEILKWMEE
ncbi:MAG: hypothetical protein CMQ41_05545 [Gammaproteobacteria bacterium]|nr:hypothetical protein [Gammaproteobacteria bacterium]|tara:strand:+ start:3489 stop:3743 length:255 start_codon:yes stop_codon:yes gene_type:complete